MEKLENNILVICPNEQKLKILNQLQQESKLYNIKFMTKEEYLKNYFFLLPRQSDFVPNEKISL